MSKRIGRTVVDEGREFEVVFPCADATPPAASRSKVEPWQAVEDMRGCRERVLALLAEESPWSVMELRHEVGPANVPLFYACLQNLRRAGVTVHPERGVIALVASRQGQAA